MSASSGAPQELIDTIALLDLAEQKGTDGPPCTKWLHAPFRTKVVEATTPEGTTALHYCGRCERFWVKG